MFKKSIMFLLCVAMVFGASVVSVPQETPVKARTISDVEREISECQTLLKTLQNELTTIKNNIDSIQSQTGQQMALIEQYQAEIEGLEAEIAVNQTIKESYDFKRAQVASDIAINKEDYDYRVSMYLNLMQFIYENGNTNSFELLFSSKNISEYLTRRDNFNDIMAAANRLLKEIEGSIGELEALDSELAATQAEYESYLDELEKKQVELDKKVKEFETLVSELNLDMDSISAEYANKNVQIKQIKARLSELEEERKELYAASSGWGVPLASYSRITSGYGNRKDPINGKTAFHNGIDFAAPRGTPILAANDGVVTRADRYSGYGNCVIIYHGNGVSTLYGHADDGNSSRPTFEVSVGQAVKKGDVIAYVGTTGRSTGYHLHFSMIQSTSSTTGSGNYVNPYKYYENGF